MNYCKIENGEVVNTSLWDEAMPEKWAAPGDVWIQNDEAQIGWKYDGVTFAAPAAAAVPAPSTDPHDYPLSKRQICAALILSGQMNLDAFVTGIIGSIADLPTRALALNDWQNARTYTRDNPLFNEPNLLAAAQMTAAQVDQIWLLAARQPV